jgi:hypothetical protein
MGSSGGRDMGFVGADSVSMSSFASAASSFAVPVPCKYALSLVSMCAGQQAHPTSLSAFSGTGACAPWGGMQQRWRPHAFRTRDMLLLQSHHSTSGCSGGGGGHAELRAFQLAPEDVTVYEEQEEELGFLDAAEASRGIPVADESGGGGGGGGNACGSADVAHVDVGISLGVGDAVDGNIDNIPSNGDVGACDDIKGGRQRMDVVGDGIASTLSTPSVLGILRCCEPRAAGQDQNRRQSCGASGSGQEGATPSARDPPPLPLSTDAVEPAACISCAGMCGPVASVSSAVTSSMATGPLGGSAAVGRSRSGVGGRRGAGGVAGAAACGERALPHHHPPRGQQQQQRHSQHQHGYEAPAISHTGHLAVDCLPHSLLAPGAPGALADVTQQV